MNRNTWLVSLFGVWMLAACGEVIEATQPDAGVSGDAPVQPAFTVGGTVSGFAGRDFVLQLNGGNDLTVTADGAFTFPGTLDANAAYTVTIKSAPVCPERICTLAAATGTISADVTDIVVSCRVPLIRIVSQNWGGKSVRVTDDIAALADGATAAPRVITGAATGLDDSELDGAAFDPGRDLIYAASQNTTAATFGISVFGPASSVTGNTAPQRRILIAGVTSYNGIELDAAADRLYLSGADGNLYVLASASTLDGTVTPTATITSVSPGVISLDRLNDRLYVLNRSAGMAVFDTARQITSATTPTRSFTWTLSDTPRFTAIDGCRNRLYLGIRNVSAAGHNLYVLDNAHTLTGVIDIEAGAARASVPDNQILAGVLDTQGALYFWDDSATTVRILNAPHLLTGSTAVAVDKSIIGVVDRGYGLDVMSY